MSKNSSKISNENKQEMLFRPKYAQKWILGSTLPRYHECQFSGKTDIFDFFGPDLPKNEFRGQNFENLSLDLKLAPPRYHFCQFSDKTDSFDFFGQNLPKNRFRLGNSES